MLVIFSLFAGLQIDQSPRIFPRRLLDGMKMKKRLPLCQTLAGKTKGTPYPEKTKIWNDTRTPILQQARHRNNPDVPQQRNG